VVFVISYIILRLIGGALTEGVRQTSLSGLDRGLGLGIGLARAVVLLGGFSLLLNAATPPERAPRWITRARLYPLASAAGDALRVFGPKGVKLAHDVAPALAAAVAGESSADLDSGARPSSTKDSRPARRRHDADEPAEDLR
jgi:membrane protein required for colicin V production